MILYMLTSNQWSQTEEHYKEGPPHDCGDQESKSKKE